MRGGQVGMYLTEQAGESGSRRRSWCMPPLHQVPQQPHPCPALGLLRCVYLTPLWHRREEPQLETVGTPRAWHPQKNTTPPPKVGSHVGSIDPVEMCPTSESASWWMGFHNRNPATLGRRRFRERLRRRETPLSLTRTLSQRDPAVTAHGQGGSQQRPGVPVGAAHLSALGSAAGYWLPFILTRKPMSGYGEFS